MIRFGSSSIWAEPPTERSVPRGLSARRGLAAAAAVRLALAVALFCLALLPRAQGLDQYVTVDEHLTLGRTGNFAEGVATGRWQRTYQIGHPEVTVMWVALVALGPSRAREFAEGFRVGGRPTVAPDVVERPGFMDALVRARLGLVIVHGVLLAVAGLLIWRLAGPAAGLLGGAMLALEPFLVAHGQLLRADALLAELMLVAVLAANAYWLRGAGPWALFLASGATGLALLAKTPAIVLLPLIGGTALVARWYARGTGAVVIGRTALELGVWLLGAAVVYVALWPSMWVQPVETLRRVVEYTLSKGGAPMDAGSYLLGEALPDPGPLFYGVALLLRLSPFVLGGFLALLAMRGGRGRRRVLAAQFLAVALVFGVAMAVAAKKADRYMLPLVPFLVAAAGLGIAELVHRRRTVGLAVGLSVVVLGQALSLLSVWPYPLTYYNPLAGGGAGASRAMLVGWGEGLDQVARALNRRPDAASSTVAVFYPDALGAQFAGEAVPLEAYDVADFVVLYVASDQRGLTPPPLAAVLADQPPELEVYLNGIRYAHVYRLAPTELAGGVRLDGIKLADRTVERDERVDVTVRWAIDALTPDLRSRLTLLRPDGREIAASLGPRHASPQPGQLLEERHRFPAPDRLGRYTVALALRTEPTGEPLAVVRRPPGLPEAPTELVFRSVWVYVR